MYGYEHKQILRFCLVAPGSCRRPPFSPCRIMISPTDADGSFIAHNGTKGLPDQAEIIPRPS